MTAQELWNTFCKKEKIAEDTPYEAWAFGGAPDYLASLVMQGIKTATASGYDLYFLEGEEEPLPKAVDYSVILNARDEAVCVIQTTKTKVVPFDEVGEEQAYKEGEGDRSLAYWRNVHDEFFTEDYKSCGAVFTHESKILCEEFKVVYSLFEVVPFEEADARKLCDWKYQGEYAVYNYPSWEECLERGIGFTDESIRKKEFYKVLKDGIYFGYFRLEALEDAIELSVGIRPELCGNHSGDLFLNLALAKMSELYPGQKMRLTVRPFNKRAMSR